MFPSRSRFGPCRAKFNTTGSFVKMANESLIEVNEQSDDLVEKKELFEEEDNLIVLRGVSSFMRCDLNRIKNYFEVTVPAYAPSKFRSPFQKTKADLSSCAEKLSTQHTFEILTVCCRVSTRIAQHFFHSG